MFTSHTTSTDLSTSLQSTGSPITGQYQSPYFNDPLTTTISSSVQSSSTSQSSTSSTVPTVRSIFQLIGDLVFPCWGGEEGDGPW